MENIKKYHPLLSKCNDAVAVKGSVQDIVKIFIIFNKWSGRCLQHVSSYTLLVSSGKKFTSIISLSGLHRRYFVLLAIVIWCKWRSCIVSKVYITHCLFFNSCFFIVMKLTCAWCNFKYIFKFDPPCLFFNCS